MKPEKLFTVLFVCMGVLLAMMYGVFELGGWEMGVCEKVFKIISLKTIAAIFVATTAFMIIVYICYLDCNKTNCNKIYVCDNGSIEIQGDLHSFYVLKDEKKDKVPKATEAVIYCGSDILKKESFEDTSSLKCLAFAKNAHKIEKDLYKMILENDVNISVCNGSVLMVVNKKGEIVSSVGVIQRTDSKEQQKCAVNGQIDLSVRME